MGHPKPLRPLFFTEMWERFSYYSIRTLLVLFMVATVGSGGFGFDEVTASLDPEMVREVLVLINDLAKEGRTMLIVTHEMEFARAIADRIIFMDKGEIIEENTVQNFFQHPQTQRAQAFLTTFDFNHF